MHVEPRADVKGESHVTIPSAYKKALRAWAGDSAPWYANWPVGEAHTLGENGRLHGDTYVFESTPTIPFEVDKSQVKLDSWTYQSGRDMSVKIGADAAVPGFEFLGKANAGIRAEFGSTNSVYVSVSGARIERVADVAPLRRELLARGQDRMLPRGSALVLATLTAEKALILTSNSRNVLWEARAQANVAVPPSVAAELAGNLSIVSGTAAVDVQDYATEQVVLAMRLLVLVRRGWLWWRDLQTLGVAPPGADQQLDLLEAMSDDTDYFTLFNQDQA